MAKEGSSRPSTRQKIKKIGKNVKSIWQYTRQLFSVSGVNGVSHIFIAKTISRRIMWIALFTLSVTGWLYQVALLLQYYYQYPTTVKIDVVKSTDMDFPGLTICNMNRIRKSVFCEYFPERCNVSVIQLEDDEIRNISLNFAKEGKKLILGHQMLDLIVSCKFTGQPKLKTESCLGYFQVLYDPNLGNCYSLMSEHKEKLTVTDADAWSKTKELQLVLNVETDEYLDAETKTPGLIVTIHENMEYPEVFTHGVHVHANYSYNLAIDKVTVHLLAKPYKTNCTDYDTLPYHTLSKLGLTPRLCTVECLMHAQRKYCKHGYITDNVVLYAKELPYNPKDITEADKRCAKDLSDNIRGYCTTLCAVPCNDIHYRVLSDLSPNGDNVPATKEEIRIYRDRSGKNGRIYMAGVHIHYKSMEEQIYRHSPEFTTETLFTYLGGITGGWLGISLLEFWAFLEGTLSVLFFSISTCRSRNKRRKNRRYPHFGIDGHYNYQYRPDYGTMVLGLPAPNSHRRMQIVPHDYNY